MDSVKIETPVVETTSWLSSLSIVVDDFDCDTNTSTPLTTSSNTSATIATTSSSETSTSGGSTMPEVSLYQPPPRPYTRQSSDAMIQKILEEAELRKLEFWKLIDEHNAVVENLKKMEQLENNTCTCKVSSQTTALRT